MGRALIEIPISGDTCVFDLTGEWLYLKSNPKVLANLGGVPLVDKQYVFRPWDASEPLVIPQLLDVAPNIFKEHYSLQKVDTWGMDDREAKLYQPDLIGRLQGEPVTLDIGGCTYYLDLKHSVFLPAKDDEYKPIKLKDIRLIEKDGHGFFRFLYDFDKHEVAKDFGEHVREVEIPSPHRMDQVGLCRICDLPLIDTIKGGYAVKNNYTAKVLGKQQNLDMGRMKPRHRQRGKGI